MLALLADATQATDTSPYHVRLPALGVSILLGIVIPLLIDLVTKRTTGSSLKALLLAGLAAAAGLVTQAIVDDGTAVVSAQGIVLAVTTWVSGAIAHGYLWKPTGVSDHVEAKVGVTDQPKAGRVGDGR